MGRKWSSIREIQNRMDIGIRVWGDEGHEGLVVTPRNRNEGVILLAPKRGAEAVGVGPGVRQGERGRTLPGPHGLLSPCLHVPATSEGRDGVGVLSTTAGSTSHPPAQGVLRASLLRARRWGTTIATVCLGQEGVARQRVREK